VKLQTHSNYDCCFPFLAFDDDGKATLEELVEMLKTNSNRPVVIKHCKKIQLLESIQLYFKDGGSN